MKVISGTVVHGRIEVDTDLAEGTAVAILVASDEGFALSPDEEEELASSLAEIRSGHYEDGHALLRELREMTRR